MLISTQSGEVKGASAAELRSAIDLVIFNAYPRKYCPSFTQ